MQYNPNLTANNYTTNTNKVQWTANHHHNNNCPGVIV